MNNTALLKSAFLILALLLFIPLISAQFVVSTEYGDGWQKICYDDEEWLSQRCESKSNKYMEIIPTL